MDTLKSAWKGMQTTNTQQDALRNMLLERKHPVLKHIRLQMIIEVIAFSVLLLVYYDFFDGDRKPLYLNLLLAGALVFAVAHSVTGYIMARRKINGDNLTQSLTRSLSAMRRFAIVSVSARAATAICLLLFFTAAISFDTMKYLALGGIIIIFLVQGWIMTRMWKSRIRELQASVQSLKNIL
jgi:hypothetical protein